MNADPSHTFGMTKRRSFRTGVRSTECEESRIIRSFYMNTKELLTELNLSEREATLYLALLEHGQGTPTTLSQKTGLKRPTVYLDLESLRRKKLVGLSFKGKRTIYVPESPHRLRANIDEQRKTLDTLLPALTALEKKGDKPQVRYFDDRKDIYRMWTHEIWTYPENYYITHLDLLGKAFPELISDYEKVVRSGSMKKVRELYTATQEDIALAKKLQRENHQIRIMPKGTEFELDISIWKDGVALFSSKDIYMLVISGDAIVKSFLTLFRTIWTSAKKPEDLVKKSIPTPKTLAQG